ncbi:TM0106 family RecB-like putative nuclease [Rothia santali]|uniref:TM0106 family RecB-like putative nuclease n=1 Tax=Rothia santali TaxID=2949643 RepID=UPI002815E155|nr:TM0106 family RecB-like putative nuclease [Rothia santali]
MFFVQAPTAPASGRPVESALGEPERTLVYSATDLVRAAECPWATLRILDEKLGRVPRLEVPEDAMLEHTSRLGDEHEAAVLADLTARYGPFRAAAGAAASSGPQNTGGPAGSGVYEIEPARRMDHATLTAKHEESVRALREGADVVFQASFYDGRFHGRSDFLIRRPDGTYEVYDTKLARHAKVTALLQLAAYADQLAAAGIPVADRVTLILGNREHASFDVGDFLAVYRERRERFEALTTAHRDPARGPVRWFDDDVARCGRCPHCEAQIAEHRDVLQVAGMSLTSRKRLRERHGVRTVEDLAGLPELDERGHRLPDAVRQARRQARMQCGLARPDGTVEYLDAAGENRTVSYTVEDPGPLRRIPRANPGDVFFDFEGDPLWQDAHDSSWGIEYLFGVVELPEDAAEEPRFISFWAHSRAEEKQALLDFLAYLRERRERHPGLKVYHYANYEKRALRDLAARHGVGEEDVDDLLRHEVLVDLYDAVRSSIRISQPSYSIKKLEPLYMGEQLRGGDVTDAAASVVAYADYCLARDSGEETEAALILDSIHAYNRYDCVSTLRLRDWLLGLAGRDVAEELATPQAPPPPPPDPDAADARTTPVEASLNHFVETATPESTGLAPEELERTARAVAMVSSATGYHRRERKQFWWAHFDRLSAPVGEWEGQRDVVVFERLAVAEDWHTPGPRAKTERRTLAGTARIADGFSLKPGASGLFAMYAAPLPGYLADKVLQSQERLNALTGGNAPVVSRASDARATVESIEPAGAQGLYRVEVTETRPQGTDAFPQLPLALTPPAPIRTQAQEDSLAELAQEVDAALWSGPGGAPHLPHGAGLDVLARRAPRLTGEGPLPQPEDPEHTAAELPMVSAIHAAVSRLDDSYLAVQGPPGTGKSFVGSHVIGRLVAEGWKVGVVAQSHAVIENLLRGCLTNGGVPGEAIAKAKPRAAKKAEDDVELPPPPPWRQIGPKEIPGFLAEEGGRIYGGTAWDFANQDRFEPGRLDLLVIDEAGQYSLANMLAVSRAARNMLLLGDPQQLPQVTQGSHPYPVDESALGWLSAGERTLPAEFGYFLDASWRMHPELCAPVSRLSYRGRLHSAPAAGERDLVATRPGVYRLDIGHLGNATSSREEARGVVRVAQQFLGRGWRRAPDQEERPLQPADVLVVAAYNAQVDAIRQALEEAGLADADQEGVRVGTVDRFQGQEAPVVVVSMAASSAEEVPRGMDFLLSPNRLNVAVSRGQWCAVIVSSPHLTDYWPATPEGLATLGGFVTLRQEAKAWNAVERRGDSRE